MIAGGINPIGFSRVILNIPIFSIGIEMPQNINFEKALEMHAKGESRSHNARNYIEYDEKKLYSKGVIGLVDTADYTSFMAVDLNIDVIIPPMNPNAPLNNQPRYERFVFGENGKVKTV